MKMTVSLTLCKLPPSACVGVNSTYVLGPVALQGLAIQRRTQQSCQALGYPHPGHGVAEGRWGVLTEHSHGTALCGPCVSAEVPSGPVLVHILMTNVVTVRQHPEVTGNDRR